MTKREQIALDVQGIKRMGLSDCEVRQNLKEAMDTYSFIRKAITESDSVIIETVLTYQGWKILQSLMNFVGMAKPKLIMKPQALNLKGERFYTLLIEVKKGGI